MKKLIKIMDVLLIYWDVKTNKEIGVKKMRMTSATLKMLAQEHENILKVAEALGKECDLIEQREDIDERFFMGVIAFVRNYADKFHHAKEEDILFKEFEKLAKEGRLHCNPIEQMLFEHDEGRKFIAAMANALEKKDKKNLIKNSLCYVNLIQEHIFKEDNILYPMADNALNEETKREMLKKFKEIGKRKRKEEKHCLGFVNSLEGRK